MAKRRWVWTSVALALLAGVILLRAVAPALTRLFPPCPVHRWTGWHCPGCGGTRCAQRLLDGDLAGAIAMNPMVVLAGSLLGVWLAGSVVAEWRGRRPWVPPAWAGWALLGLTVGFAATRNVPWWPFTLLAPN
jgi:hypothetical protein